MVAEICFAIARHTCADPPKSPLRKPLSSPKHSHMLQVNALHLLAAVPKALARNCDTVFGAFVILEKYLWSFRR